MPFTPSIKHNFCGRRSEVIEKLQEQKETLDLLQKPKKKKSKAKKLAICQKRHDLSSLRRVRTTYLWRETSTSVERIQIG